MAYATYQDYTGRFCGRAIPDAETFDQLAVRTDAVLDRLTFGRAAKYHDTEGKLALACCAVAEKLYEISCSADCGDASGRIAAEQVGDHRVEYRRIREADSAAELAALAELYLFGTGLMYRGVPAFSDRAW